MLEINMEGAETSYDPDASRLDIFLKECNLLYKRDIYIPMVIVDSKQLSHEMRQGVHQGKNG